MRLAPLLASLLIATPAVSQSETTHPAVSEPPAPQPTPPQPAPQPTAPWTEAAARQTLAEVKAASAEGLIPAAYGKAALESALASGDLAAIATAAEASWLALAHDYAAGHTPLAARIGWKSPPPRSDPDWLRARLNEALASGSTGATLKALLPTHPYYAVLKAALPRTTDSAERARLRANLDRWRWMPRQMGTRYLFANIPAFEADLVENDKPIARHKIIVGSVKTPTPQFSTIATAVIINPSWYLPDSIVKESVGSLIRRSPNTARAKGYSWTATADGLQVTQKPGRGNSLGTLKIEMPNPWAIYFHDTPAKQLFAKPMRALSHGCMRTQGILGLALRLLEDQAEWDAARIDSTAATNETMRVPLPAQIPAHIAYFTVAPGPGGTLRSFADVYGRDAPVIAALDP